jgi:hypothetical protein
MSVASAPPLPVQNPADTPSYPVLSVEDLDGYPDHTGDMPSSPQLLAEKVQKYGKVTGYFTTSFKIPFPKLGGGRLGGQGPLFLDRTLKFIPKKAHEEKMEFTISFTYDSPVFYLKIKASGDTKVLDLNVVSFQLNFTSGSGKKGGYIHEDLDAKALKSEDGYIAKRTNSPESCFRKIFFNGNSFFKSKKDITYTIMLWFRHEPDLQRLGSMKFQKLNETLFLNKESSGDLKIICEERTFDCHKLVLSCQSEVFRKMFERRMVEDKTGKVNIDDVKPEVMESMLFFIYHDEIEDKMKINSELLLAADKYNIPGLLDVCANYLEANLSLENALDVMFAAYLTNQTSLFGVASNFVCENKGQLIKSQFWNEMLLKNPELIGKAFNEAML